MGWEEAVPPVPNRVQELQMIENYRDEMISQPYWKIHANEAQRPMKLQHSRNLNTVYGYWFRNFFAGLVVTGPLVVFPFARRFVRMNTGVPYFHRPKFVFATKAQHNQARNWAVMKQAVPLWFLSANAYAYWYTDFSLIDDENLEKYQSGVDRF